MDNHQFAFAIVKSLKRPKLQSPTMLHIEYPSGMTCRDVCIHPSVHIVYIDFINLSAATYLCLKNRADFSFVHLSWP